jgi:hypothetical protein
VTRRCADPGAGSGPPASASFASGLRSALPVRYGPVHPARLPHHPARPPRRLLFRNVRRSKTRRRPEHLRRSRKSRYRGRGKATFQAARTAVLVNMHPIGAALRAQLA